MFGLRDDAEGILAKKILMEDDEIREKELEIVGHLLRARYPEIAEGLKRNHGADTERQIALDASEYMPVDFAHFEEIAKGIVKEWLEQEQERLDLIDPPFTMDKFDYLRPEI